MNPPAAKPESAAIPPVPVPAPSVPAPARAEGFALLRTIPLSPAEWRRPTGSPFPRRD